MGLLIKFKWYSDFGKVTIPVAFESPNLYGRQFPFLVLSFGLPRGIYVSSVYKQFPFLVLKIECGHNWSLFRQKGNTESINKLQKTAYPLRYVDSIRAYMLFCIPFLALFVPW